MTMFQEINVYRNDVEASVQSAAVFLFPLTGNSLSIFSSGGWKFRNNLNPEL